MLNNLKDNDILELSDGKKYVICCALNYETEKYLYIIEEGNTKNFKFCRLIVEETGGEIEEVEDKKLLNKIIPLFSEIANKKLDELLKETKEQN